MENRSIINVALIGCGEHSQENIIPVICQLTGINVVIACDTNKQWAIVAAKKLGNCLIEVDFNRVLSRSDLDAIIVAATPQVHFQAALIALRKGIHVFVEKPPTKSYEDLLTLANEARMRNLVTCVGHNLRHATAAIEMQSVLRESQEEVFGNPIAMEMRYFASKPHGDRWQLNSPLRSFLLSHANHAIDFMIYQMGAINNVNAVLASSSEEGITLSVQFVFKNGAVGNLLATSFAPHFSISGTIVSDKNKIVSLNSLNEVIAFGIGNDKKRWGRYWTNKTLLTGYESAGYFTEMQCFFDAIRHCQPEMCQPSFSDELAVYDAIEQIQEKLVSLR